MAEHSNTFGSFIRERRAEKGLTLAEMHTRSGIHFTALSLLETGRRKPNLGHLQKLSGALGVTVTQLLKKLNGSGKGRGSSKPVGPYARPT